MTLILTAVGDSVDIRWRFSHPLPKSKSAYKRLPDEQKCIATLHEALNETLGRCGGEE